jgi:hypothetical protein
MIRPADEYTHPRGPSTAWCETWELDLVDGAGALGVVLRQTVRPELGRLEYTLLLLGAGRDPVAVVDHEMALPSRMWRDGGLELRASGLWSDLEVETPLEHVALGVEAFGVALDAPRELHDAVRGERVPVGLDLEWESDSTAVPWTPPGFVGHGYELRCRVSGEVLVGAERFVLDTHGARRHWWGTPEPAVTGADPPGSAIPSTTAAPLDGREVVAWAPMSRTERWTLLRSPGGDAGAWLVQHGPDGWAVDGTEETAR